MSGVRRKHTLHGSTLLTAPKQAVARVTLCLFATRGFPPTQAQNRFAPQILVFRLRFGPSALLTTASRFFAVTGGPGIAFCRTEHKAEGRPILHSAFCILHSPAAQEWYRPPPAVRPFHRLGLSLHGTLRVLLRPCRFDRGTISPGGEIVNRGFSSAGRRSVRCGGTGVFPPAGGTRAGEFRRLRAASDFANSGKVTKTPFRNLRFLKISLRQFLMLTCLSHPARGQKSKERLLLRPLPLVV